MRKINLIWKYKREGRRQAAAARHEKEISKENYNAFIRDVLQPMNDLQKQNHFAEILAESLARGYDSK